MALRGVSLIHNLNVIELVRVLLHVDGDDGDVGDGLAEPLDQELDYRRIGGVPVRDAEDVPLSVPREFGPRVLVDGLEGRPECGRERLGREVTHGNTE